MGYIVASDRELLDIWVEHGIPTNVSTQEKRDELVLKLWEAIQVAEERIEELLPFVIQKCLNCGAVTAPLEGSDDG